MIKREMETGTILCYGAVVAMLLLYGLPFQGEVFYVIRMALVIAVGLLCAIRFAPMKWYVFIRFRGFFKVWKKVYLQAVVLLAAVLVGALILGNTFADTDLSKAVLHWLGKFWGETNIQLLPVSYGNPVQGLQTGTFHIGDHRDIGDWNVYNQGLTSFAAAYGMILVMILGVNFIFRRRLAKKKAATWKDRALYEIFLLSVAALPVMLFFTDFVDFTDRSWLKSRFMEGPVYVILFASFYFIHRACSRKEKIVIGGILVFYMIVPFVATERPRQIWHNAGTLADVAKDAR